MAELRGTGTAADPYLIGSVAEYLAVAAASGSSTHIRQTADIDFTAYCRNNFVRGLTAHTYDGDFYRLDNIVSDQRVFLVTNLYRLKVSVKTTSHLCGFRHILDCDLHFDVGPTTTRYCIDTQGYSTIENTRITGSYNTTFTGVTGLCGTASTRTVTCKNCRINMDVTTPGDYRVIGSDIASVETTLVEINANVGTFNALSSSGSVGRLHDTYELRGAITCKNFHVISGWPSKNINIDVDLQAIELVGNIGGAAGIKFGGKYTISGGINMTASSGSGMLFVPDILYLGPDVAPVFWSASSTLDSGRHSMRFGLNKDMEIYFGGVKTAVDPMTYVQMVQPTDTETYHSNIFSSYSAEQLRTDTFLYGLFGFRRR